MRKAEVTLNSANKMLETINKGDGTIGKLVSDDKLYNNIAAMSKELESLLREMKLNPKRFVHFSLFGKKAKPYTPNKKIVLEKEDNK
jgi:phospholipid/cholesterol/gamma-HCH transport system substrate-binding protein